MDYIFLVKCGGKPTIVNLSFVTSATYDEELRRLTINFVGGEALDVEGQDAADVWEEMVTSRLSDSTTDEDDGEEDGDTVEGDLEDDGLENAEIETDLDIEGITQQIKDLENQIQSGQVKGLLDILNLSYEVELLGKRKLQTEEIERLREKALDVMRTAATIFHRERIKGYATTHITN